MPLYQVYMEHEKSYQCSCLHTYIGSSRSSWSCYFLPETSPECRDRAFQIMKQKEAWEKGIITIKENYTSKEIWSGRTPR